MSYIRTRIVPAAALAAATLLTPIAAYAAGGGSVSVTPNPAGDRQAVTVNASGCSDKSTTAFSKAFSKPITLTLAQGKLSGTGTIGKNVKPGKYNVQTVCTVGKARTTAMSTVNVNASMPAKPNTPAKPAH